MNSIFIKQSELPSVEHKISNSLLINAIPANAYSEEQKELKKYKTEWRWRFLKINDKTVVEISFCEPNKERQYVDKFGKWISYNVDPMFDQFVTKAYYYYAD